jgi:hypothetical protein
VVKAFNKALDALFNEVSPVPPFAGAKVPVTPGVIFLVPLKLTADVEARLVLIVLDVAS